MGNKKLRKTGWVSLTGTILFAAVLVCLRTASTLAAENINKLEQRRPTEDVGQRASLAVDANPLEILWTGKVLAPDGAAGDAFSPVGVSGGTLIAGAPQDNSGTGGAYLFSRNQGGQDNWGYVLKVTASDGTTGDNFGSAVGVDGDLAVVGAPLDDSGTGSAYIFARNQGGRDNWGQVGKITASDGAPGDQFGTSVSIYQGTVVVGAPGDDAGGSQAGAAYVFYRNQGGADGWGEVEKITATDGESEDSFGSSVAVWQGFLAIGAPHEDTAGSNAGAVYLFARNQGGADNWGQIEKLTAGDGAGDDWFGGAVAGDNDLLVIGAAGEDDRGSGSGAVYLFARNEGGADNWGQIEKLTASDGAGGDQFGAAVAIQNDAVAIGAPGEDASGSGAGAGYLYERNNGGADHWNEVGKISPTGLGAGDGLGTSLAMSENTVVLGAPGDDDQGAEAGAAHLFERYGTAWTEVQQPSHPDPDDTDYFGEALDLNGDTLVVGARLDDAGGTDAGAAFVYTRNQGGVDNWGAQTTLTPSDGVAGDEFGTSVAIHGDTIVVGAPFAGGNQGAAYVFTRNQDGADQWGQTAKLTPGDPAGGDQFGLAVAVHGDIILVGAPKKDTTSPTIFNTGAVYVFYRNQGGADNWGEVTSLAPINPAENDWFGFRVHTNGDYAAVSKPHDDTGHTDSGSVYLFARNQGGADNWGYVKKVQASDGGTDDRFGWSLAMDRDTLVVGAINNDTNGENSGAGYVFERNFGGLENWGEVARLDPNYPHLYADLGWAIDIVDNFVLIGAPNDTDGLNQSGAVHLFARNQGGADNWGQLNWVAPSDANTFDFFGSAVALDANTIAAGMYTGDQGGQDAGVVYLYQWDNEVNTLSITKTGNPGGSVPVHELVEYTLTYVNQWPEIVTGVVITDIVPYPLTNLTYYSTGPTLTLLPGQAYAWQVDDLGPGEGGVITIQGEIIDGLTEEISFENTATIRGAVLGITETRSIDSVTLTVSLSLNAHTGGPYFVDEGATVLLDASLSSEGGAPITTYEWDLDNDGMYDDATGVTTLFNATADDYVQVIGLRVTDSTLDQDTATSTVTVQNVAPTVFAGPGWTGDPGLVVVLPPATYSDPGLLDVLSCSIDWGDGTVVPRSCSPGSGTISGSHLYPDPGYFLVTVRVTDDDGGVGFDQFPVQLGEVLYLPFITR